VPRAHDDQEDPGVDQLVAAQHLARVGSWTWDPRTGASAWSPELFRIFGIAPGRPPLTGEELLALVHADDRGRLAADFAATFAGGEGFDLDYRIVLPDGEVRVLHALGRADAEHPGAFAGTVQDVTELRAVERRLRGQQELLEAMIERAPIGKALVGLDGRFLRVNAELCRITGRDQATLLACTFQGITHPEDLGSDVAHVERLLAGELDSYRIDKRYVRPDGTTVWVRLAVTLLREEDGSPAYFVAQVEDVDEARGTFAALRRSEARLHAILDNAPAAIVLRDLDGRLEYANDHAPDALHASLEAVAGPGAGDAPHEARVEETTTVDADGTRRVHHVVRYPVREADGTLVGLGSFAIDVTDRHAAAREVREAREQAALVVEAMSEGFALTVDGVLTSVNGALCELTGFPREALLGTRAPFPFTPADAAPPREGEAGRLEADLQRADGSRFVAEVTTCAARDEDGVLLGHVHTVRDVSARRRYEAELERLASQDPLTGLANVRVLHERLEGEVARARRYDRPLSVVVLDIDHFKRVNDLHGHPAGDVVLRRVAQTLQGVARNGELLARVGGEEFVWLLPEADGRGAFAAADRARRAIERLDLDGVGRVTVSAGVCDLEEALDSQDLLKRADSALYAAKRFGRDRVVRYSAHLSRHLARLTADPGAARSLTLAELARTAESKHPDVADHARRVAELATALAEAGGWAAEDVRALDEAALLHDVGKVAVPDAILSKAGPLTDAELAQVRTHAAVGAEMLRATLTAEQVSWVRHHHERWDGAGYPGSLTGPETPPGAQLLALADAFDAMTHARPYRSALTHAQAVAEVHRSAGTHFSPWAVELFDRVVLGARTADRAGA
jgi:diguanylate cyclase (GGDEF)-like protein/PAS domain S-box-containing protein/putative nucleotidyltransferase with HDIG domain